jgi:capsular exopolysaccharide synthesis family protein
VETDQHGSEVDALSREPFPIELANRASSANAARGPRQMPSRVGPIPTTLAPTPPASASGAHAGAQTSNPSGGAVPPGATPSTGGGTADESVPRDTVFERIDHKLAEKVVADRNISSLSREQYRRLAAVLHDAQSQSGMSVIMIASALSGEGKTLTSSNLALTLSESYQKRVLLIDADLRKPTLHQVFKIDSLLGLTDGLAPGNEGKLTVHQVSQRLSVLPAGRPTTDPMAGLISDRMRRLIDEARESFDWVIVDTPPVVLLPDANLLAAMVDATVLVVRAESTPHRLVKRAVDALGAQRIIGTVLNQAAAAPGERYGAYSYYYGNGRRYLEQKDVKNPA